MAFGLLAAAFLSGALMAWLLGQWCSAADEAELRPGGPEIRVAPTNAWAKIDGVGCRLWRGMIDGRPMGLYVYRVFTDDEAAAELLRRSFPGGECPPPRRIVTTRDEPSAN